MPLYREWPSDPYSLAAIWQIDEPETFFTERTGYRSEIKNEKRRLEHLAGRFLLKHLKADFPLLNIKPDIHDKPRIDDNQYFFSISHSYPYVAAVVSPYVECGIDIQVWHPRMELLQRKFLSQREQELFKNDPKLITMAWCAKEAAYKWQGRRGVEFADHLVITHFGQEDQKHNITIHLQLTVPKMEITSESIVGKEFCYSVIGNRSIVHPTF
jgi:4'-phosphopantetheinyl transferase